MYLRGAAALHFMRHKWGSCGYGFGVLWLLAVGVWWRLTCTLVGTCPPSWCLMHLTARCLGMTDWIVLPLGVWMSLFMQLWLDAFMAAGKQLAANAVAAGARPFVVLSQTSMTSSWVRTLRPLEVPSLGPEPVPQGWEAELTHQVILGQPTFSPFSRSNSTFFAAFVQYGLPHEDIRQ